jgi:hypothetical protein
LFVWSKKERTLKARMLLMIAIPVVAVCECHLFAGESYANTVLPQSELENPEL